MKLRHQLFLGLLTVWMWWRYPNLTNKFVRRNGHYPCTAFPITANEKFLWRKVFDHDPRFPTLIDKIICKQWVAKNIPSLRVAELLWSGTDASTIPEHLLEGRVVFKPNNNSGRLKFISKNSITPAELAAIGDKWLALDYSLKDGKWGYGAIQKQLLLEKEIQTNGPYGLEEIKIYTFGKRIGRIVHIWGRFQNIYANAWEVSASGKVVRSKKAATVGKADLSMPPPAYLHDAKSIAKAIGSQFDHVRVDLLWDGRNLWLGELTFYNQTGNFSGKMGKAKYSEMTRYWDLRRSNFLKQPPQHWVLRRYAKLLRGQLSKSRWSDFPRFLSWLMAARSRAFMRRKTFQRT